MQSLPLIIAGPILRDTTASSFNVWLVSTRAIQASLLLFDEAHESITLKCTEQLSWPIGEACYIHLFTAELGKNKLCGGSRYYYDLNISEQGELSALLPALTYENQGSTLPRFSFLFANKLTNVIHGSCRKAHHYAKDALPQLANLVSPTQAKQDIPDLVLMTGDQVYIDDVAGPMLHAIQQTITLLGLFHEDISGSTIASSADLLGHAHCFYERALLLPKTEGNKDLSKAFFKAKQKPVFTSVNADNHLIALNEMLALYLLSWSSRLWSFIDLHPPQLKPEYIERYNKEKQNIEAFVESLPAVEKALAHVPVYMIFDDHDVTDDWNLTRGWEEQVYGNPYSRQIVGNAICAYFLCQGIGNPKQKLTPLIEAANQTFTEDGIKNHQAFLTQLFDFDQWHYNLSTSPPIHVLDTRTQRWRSESNPNKPSGLMDWEGLCELQQNIMGKQSVIMVSAAPVYGVKFIETVQRIFTAFGGALMVDAENWMAHKGTASVMLNVFRHIKTPPNFIILSGDVHYSFVYDVSLRFRRNSPKIVQFTCSGIHNQFPQKLINFFDRCNRLLYGHRSPLNFLTQRRNMSVKQRQPENQHGDVVNACALGLLQLSEDGTEQTCKLICADGSTVEFTQQTQD
ncbi:alkaline phosphatase D family protein [Agaribacter flavus]|uniref:Alkaline phosphatase D family protein n=1 Tax=Agaribacter flavus TaxID=1902781 RepID=A0ABV7FN97_9ALTE